MKTSRICRTAITLFALSLGSQTLVACSGKIKETLKPLDTLFLFRKGYAQVSARFCLTPPAQYRQKIKYIFVMDKSSSNQDTPDMTDPQGLRRYAPLYNFIQNSVDDPGYTYYSLVNFASSAQPVMPPGQTRPFTDDRTVFQNMVNAQWNANGFHQPLDLGFTNYVSAMDNVVSIVRTDVNDELNNPSPQVIGTIYNIVFVSDGYPVVADSGTATGTRRQTFDPEILNKINDLLSIKADPRYRPFIDEIILNTGYYYSNRDASAETLLADMATPPLGAAYTFGAGQEIDYRLFAPPVRYVRYNLTDVFVENASVMWWDNGTQLRDTDNDGLPDETEAHLGSDALAKDSDGNGVSDFVEYRTKGRPCKSSTCSRLMADRDNYAACEGMLPDLTPTGASNPTPDGFNPSPYGTNYFGDRDRDGLSDCEEWVLRGSRDEFDSNQDHIPDWLSFKAQIPYIAGTTNAGADFDTDLLLNYDEIQQGAPAFLHNSQLLNFKPVKTTLIQDGTEGGNSCFRFEANHVVTLGNDNVIRLWISQNTAAIDNKPLLRHAEKVLPGNGTQIVFEPGDFQ